MARKTSQHALWHNFFRPKDDWVEETAKICEKNLLFKDITPSVIRWFTAKMHPRSYDAGENIFHAGDEGAGAVLLRSGCVAIRKDGVDLAMLKSGDLFGEVALVEGQTRTADAVAIEACELVFLLRTDLDEWINRHPKYACVLLQNLGTMLAGRLLEANKTISDYSQQMDAK